MCNMRTNSTGGERRPCQRRGGPGFTLIEVLTALAILGFVASSVLVVVDRCLLSASDSALRMEAYQLASENMEKVLASEYVEETVEYGRSDVYPDMTWQTVIEAFAEPIGGTTWIRAVCSAEYQDSTGQRQTVEIEHWLTELTDQQADQLAGQVQSVEELTAEQVVMTAEEAAEYAGVETVTIERWIENGLLTMPDGAFIKHNLDIYARSDGKPTEVEREQQVESIEELARWIRSQTQGAEEAPDGSRGAETDPLTGLPQEQLDDMDVGEVMRLLKARREQ